MTSQRKILYIDDDRLFQQLVRDVLDNEFLVETALNGTDGLAKLRAFKPDVLLLDYEMPGMNGIEVLHAMQGEPAIARTPTVFLTGLQAVSNDQKIPRNVVAYLSKPFKPQELHSVLNGVLGAR